MKVTKVFAQEILDSRGNPTVQCTIELENGIQAASMVPSGASTGKYEAVELRDGDTTRFLGKGVLKAVQNVNEKIAPLLLGKDLMPQKQSDDLMIELDGTENKANLGANAILAVSMAYAKVTAMANGFPLYRHISNLFGNENFQYIQPIPMINVLNGGKHALNSADFQEYMLVPIGAESVQQAVQWGAECFHNLGKILKEMGFSTTVGDEGGYAPALESNEKPLEIMVEAVEKSGLKIGIDVSLAMDVAASSFFENGKYILKRDNMELNSEQLFDLYSKWVEKYPIISIEDAFDEDDWESFAVLEKILGSKIMNVGDDLYVTNVQRLKKGIEMKASNSILIKLNQIGTVSETIDAIKLAKSANMKSIVSHRSGETEDTFIADFVVGCGCGYIKTGSMSRSERIAKYNQLMRIERELGR